MKEVQTRRNYPNEKFEWGIIQANISRVRAKRNDSTFPFCCFRALSIRHAIERNVYVYEKKKKKEKKEIEREKKLVIEIPLAFSNFFPRDLFYNPNIEPRLYENSANSRVIFSSTTNNRNSCNI